MVNGRDALRGVCNISRHAEGGLWLMVETPCEASIIFHTVQREVNSYW
jgi:hypothetical protein